MLEKPVFKEPFSRHRTVMNLFDKFPVVENDVFVAPNATVVGRVGIDSLSSIWYGAVVRGDLNAVTIGRSSAIRERAVVSTTRSIEGHVDAAVIIGDNVIVGAWRRSSLLPSLAPPLTPHPVPAPPHHPRRLGRAAAVLHRRERRGDRRGRYRP